MLNAVSPNEPVVFLGHSKGGGLMLDLAHALPHRLTHLINLDGLPSKNNWPDLADHERTKMLRGELEGWLDHRRRVAGAERKPGTIEELAKRRQRMNPRLPLEWLEYLVPIGARKDHDGWRWKIDPAMRLGGFGPWRPEWSMQRLPGIGVPVLGVLGLQNEVMGWGTKPKDVYPNQPPVFRFEALDDVGHFVHIEQPRLIADFVLEFLADHPAPRPASPRSRRMNAGRHENRHEQPRADRVDVVGSQPPDRVNNGPITLVHGKSRLALHLLREGWGRPLLLLHGLGECTPATVPAHLERWGGPVYGLDFTGHGKSTLPVGGGYTAEILMADVDAALHHLGKATIYGRGLGAYIALLIAGARPTLVRGIILADGPGLVGGGIRPGSPHVATLDEPADTTPDPFALMELSRDVRPPDYAIEYVRQIMQWSELDSPIAVTTVVRPEWLTAVVDEPGVAEVSVPEALAMFAEVR